MIVLPLTIGFPVSQKFSSKSEFQIKAILKVFKPFMQDGRYQTKDFFCWITSAVYPSFEIMLIYPFKITYFLFISISRSETLRFINISVNVLTRAKSNASKDAPTCLEFKAPLFRRFTFKPLVLLYRAPTCTYMCGDCFYPCFEEVHVTNTIQLLGRCVLQKPRLDS